MRQYLNILSNDMKINIETIRAAFPLWRQKHIHDHEGRLQLRMGGLGASGTGLRPGVRKWLPCYGEILTSSSATSSSEKGKVSHHSAVNQGWQ